MKRYGLLMLVICYFFTTMPTTFAQEKTSFYAEQYDKIHITYSHGQGFPILRTKPDYSYDTSDRREIQELIECINHFSLMEKSPKGYSADGVYLGVQLGDSDGEVIYFDASCGWVNYKDRQYDMLRSDYKKLVGLIYEMKTKEDIHLYFNDVRLKPDISPQIIEGRTIVPAYMICDAIGADIEGDYEEKSIMISKNDCKVYFKIGEAFFTKNDEYIPLEVGAQLICYCAMIPIRAVTEVFEYRVEWRNNSVYIYSD